MINRKEVRQLIAEMNSYNPWTTYSVEDGKLIVRCEKGLLCKEQSKLLRENRNNILEYLTTPPKITAYCRRTEKWGKDETTRHCISWICNKYGVWVCVCYEEEIKVTPIVKPQKRQDIADYWIKEGA